MDKEWVPSRGVSLYAEARKVVLSNENALVIAGAGAGKTEVLTQKADYLLSTGKCKGTKKILALCFKTDAAKNLRDRIISRYGERYRDRIISITYDAFFKSVLDRFYRVLPDSYMIDPQYEIATVEQKQLLSAFILAGYTELNLLSGKDANAMISQMIKNYDFEEPTPDKKIKKALDILLRGTETNSAALSFLLISKLVLFLLRTNLIVKRLIRKTFSCVFLDEFQDTSDIQYDILKELFINTNVRLTAVGDINQRIMLWAGAKKSVFEDFRTEFSATEFRLNINYRSAPRLVELQKDVYRLLNEGAESDMEPAYRNEDDGTINLVVSEDEQEEAETLAEMIKDDILSGISPMDIAILCKQQAEKYVERIIASLEKYGIRARIESDYQDLQKDEAINIVLDVIALSLDRRNPEAWENVLSFFVQLTDETNSSMESYQRLQYELEGLFAEVHNLLLLAYNLDDYRLLQKKIVDFFGKEKIKSVFPTERQGTYFYDKLEKFASCIWEEFLVSKRDWKQAVQGFKGERSIPIMTIHKSKGLEYTAVYFVGLEDGAFWSFRKQPQEDRCAFMVALSRAKHKVTFTFCSFRSKLRYPEQKRLEIAEFYELLTQPDVANVIDAKQFLKHHDYNP